MYLFIHINNIRLKYVHLRQNQQSLKSNLKLYRR
nr:MAG TPA: hypothetical protein [Caudoviricetes sp.]